MVNINSKEKTPRLTDRIKEFFGWGTPRPQGSQAEDDNPAAQPEVRTDTPLADDMSAQPETPAPKTTEDVDTTDEEGDVPAQPDALVKPKRMPPLAIDEVLLLVDAYFTLQNVTDPQQRREQIQNLSDNMRRLPCFPALHDDPCFRSVGGMELCLRNVAVPSHLEKTLTFAQPSRLTKYIYNYYVDDPKRLHEIVMQIRRFG